MKYYVSYQIRGEIQMRGSSFYDSELEFLHDGYMDVYALKKLICREHLSADTTDITIIAISPLPKL